MDDPYGNPDDPHVFAGVWADSPHSAYPCIGPDDQKRICGSLLTGALSGVFASHCAVPVMVALLALVAELGRNAWWGILLMVLLRIRTQFPFARGGSGIQLCGTND